MTKQVQRRRGTSTQHTSFTGAEGEISVNTTNKSIHVHDGTTAGGVEAARADLANVSDTSLNNALSGNTLASLTITSADINGGTIDGTTIGGTSAAAVTTTSLVATTADINGGTVDGAVIGGSSAAAITGTTITATGDVTIADKIIHAGDTNTAIRFPAADTVTIETAGAERLRVDSSGNVGIGTSSPALTAGYLGLHVNGGTAAQIRVTNSTTGATATDGLTLANDVSAAYLYNYEATPLVFATSATERMRIDASGNVGIGTSSPTSRLTISGVAATGATTILSTGTTTNYNVGQFTNTGGNLYYGIDNSGGTAFSGSTAYGSIIGSGNSTNLHLVTNSIVRATLDASGNLGLGVTPSAWSQSKAFQVNTIGALRADTGTVGLNNNAHFDSGWKYLTTATATTYEQANGQHVWNTAPSGTAGTAITFTQAMTLDASGRLGIGTTSPAVKLHLGGSSDQSFEIDGSLTPTFVGTSGSVGQISVNRRPHDGIFADTGKAAAYINLSSEAGGSTITFSTTTTNNVNPSERARIDSSGNLLVGTTTQFGSGKLCIVGSQATIATKGNESTNGGGWHLIRSDTNSKCWEITGNADNLYIADADFSHYAYLSQNPTSWQFASDARIKTDVQELDYGLETVMAMQPKRYTFTQSGKVDIGFIAQELRSVVPEAVSGTELPFDAADTGQERAAKTLGVGKETLIPILVKAIQELKAEVDSLRAQLNP
jgi:hypothetical protein